MDLFDLQVVASREAKAGPETEDMGNGALPAFSGLFRYLSYTAQAHLRRHGTAHNGVSLSTSISNWENAPTDQPDGGSSSTEIPLSRVCLGLCQVAKH